MSIAKSTDQKVTKDLIETLEDGKKGFAEAADKLTEDGRADIAATFRSYSRQRAEFSTELEQLAASYGDDIDESGSVTAALHRGWMNVKDLFASGVNGVLDASEQGEDHAVKEYRKALDEDISATLRAVIERQFAEIKNTHDQVRDLRNSVS